MLLFQSPQTARPPRPVQFAHYSGQFLQYFLIVIARSRVKHDTTDLEYLFNLWGGQNLDRVIDIIQLSRNRYNLGFTKFEKLNFHVFFVVNKVKIKFFEQNLLTCVMKFVFCGIHTNFKSVSPKTLKEYLSASTDNLVKNSYCFSGNGVNGHITCFM